MRIDWLLGLLLATLLSAPGQLNAEAGGGKIKGFPVEPLPEGAIQRLGSTHWRAEDVLDFLVLSADGKMLAGSDVGGLVHVWDRTSGQRIQRLEANAPAAGLAFSRDGKLIAAVNRVGSGGVWSTETGRRIALIDLSRMGNQSPVQVTFTPDGKQIIFWLDPGLPDPERRVENHVLVVDAATGKTVRHLASAGYRLDENGHSAGPLKENEPQEFIRDVALSPDGATAAVLFTDDESRPGKALLRLVDYATGKVLHESVFRSPDKQEIGWAWARFAPDGKSVLLSGGNRYTLIEVASGKETAVWDYEHNFFWADQFAGFGPAGKTMVVHQPSFTGEVTVWNLTERKKIRAFKTIEQAPAVSDGKQIFVGNGTTVLCWDVSTGTEVPLGHVGHHRAVAAVAYSPNGKTVASAADSPWVIPQRETDCTFLWNTDKMQLPVKLSTQADVLSFSSDGRFLLSGRTLRPVDFRQINIVPDLWEAATATKLWKGDWGEKHYGCLLAAALVPDTYEVVWYRYMSDEKDKDKLTFYMERTDSIAGKRLQQVVTHVTHTPNKVPDDQKWPILSPSTLQMAESSWNIVKKGEKEIAEGKLQLVDAWTNKKVKTWRQPIPDNLLQVVRFAPDNRHICVASQSGWVTLIDVTTDKPMWRVGLDQRWISTACFSPDSRLLAIADTSVAPMQSGLRKNWLETVRREGIRVDDQAKKAAAVRLVDVATGRNVALLEYVGAGIHALAFSSDGQRLATGMNDGTVLIWNMDKLPSARK